MSPREGAGADIGREAPHIRLQGRNAALCSVGELGVAQPRPTPLGSRQGGFGARAP
jgi:hypothetical protein